MKIRTIGLICTLISEEHERKRSAYEKAKKTVEYAEERGEETEILSEYLYKARKELEKFEADAIDFLSIEIR